MNEGSVSNRFLSSKSGRITSGQLWGPVELFNCPRFYVDAPVVTVSRGLLTVLRRAGDEYSNWPAALCFGLLRSVNAIGLLWLDVCLQFPDFG